MLDDFDDWVFVRAHGITVVGKHHFATNGNPEKLSPVFEFEEHRQLTPQGMMSASQVRPVLNFLSVRSIPMPEGIKVWVKDLVPDEKRAAAKLIREAVADMDVARANAAGVTIVPAGSMPKRQS